MITQEKLNESIALMNASVQAFAIYLFGSAARQEMTIHSDIDIAFLSDQAISQYEVFCIAQELASILGREVDLVNLKAASTVFKAQVIGTGEIIFCNNELRKDEFEIRAFKEYALLNEERECILKDVKERGKIYE